MSKIDTLREYLDDETAEHNAFLEFHRMLLELHNTAHVVLRYDSGSYTFLQFHGWALFLHADGTWHIEDTSGG